MIDYRWMPREDYRITFEPRLLSRSRPPCRESRGERARLARRREVR